MSIVHLPRSALFYPQTYTQGPAFNAKAFRHIISLAKAIARDGLLNPIRVQACDKGFEVVDGKKRLMALRILSKARKLPRSLTRIPCILVDASQPPKAFKVKQPELKSDSELAEIVLSQLKTNGDITELAKRFDCSPERISKAASLTRLHPQILDYFKSGHLSLDQAAAFASLPNTDAQWRLLQELGPFAHAKTVIDAILSGQTVLDIPGGDVMILPSRNPAPLNQTQETAKAA